MILENEGNVRFTTTFPRVHVAVVGIEKGDPRSPGTGGLSEIVGPKRHRPEILDLRFPDQGRRRTGELDGPEEMHIVLLDNG